MGVIRLRKADEEWLRTFHEGSLHECVESLKLRLDPDKMNNTEFRILTNRLNKLDKKLEELENYVHERSGGY